jgi:hypothetical protein
VASAIYEKTHEFLPMDSFINDNSPSKNGRSSQNCGTSELGPQKRVRTSLDRGHGGTLQEISEGNDKSLRKAEQKDPRKAKIIIAGDSPNRIARSPGG